jgi:hypothetical protein
MPPSQNPWNLTGYVYQKPSKVVGQEAFRYWVAFLVEDYPTDAEMGQSVWLPRFYGLIDIRCIVDTTKS